MKWICCEDSLPTEDGQYLTYMMDNGCCYRQEVQRFYNKPRLLKGMYADTFTHWEKVTWDDYIVTHWMKLPEPPENHIEVEYGSFGGVRFLDPNDVHMYDSEGNIILCKCGKPAGNSCIGKESYIAWCSDCSPLPKEEVKFVYRLPAEQLTQNPKKGCVMCGGPTELCQMCGAKNR